MLETDAAAAPTWNSHKVAFIGGTYDTRIETGEEYETRTLAELFALSPARLPKLEGPAFVPSSYHEYDARNHNAQRERGSFVALTADIDSGDHSPSVIQKAVEAFAGDAAYLIYSSPHSRPGDRRWRVVVPLAASAGFDNWCDAQAAFFAFLGSRGIATDHALARSGQLVFLPNVPDTHEKTGTALRGENGNPLYFQRHATKLTRAGLDLANGPVSEGMAEIRRRRAADEAEREKMREEAAKRLANRPRGQEASLIDDFNASTSVATMLELCGYTQSTRNPDDWRSPIQTGDTYATRIMDDKWFSLSQSDTDAGLGQKCRMGCFGDAYDLYVHYKHGGDHKAAYRALGAERRAANVIHPPQFNPPDWMNEVPMPDELPEWAEQEGDIDEADYIDQQPTQTPSLPFFWFNEAEPNLEANDFVEDLLTQGTMSVVYGPSNCGKTFFVVDLALHVAWGREWRGKAVDRGAVVYLSLEGSQGIRNRLSAFRKHHNLADMPLPFVAMPKPVNLLNDDADVNAVIALVQHVAAETELPVQMVIIDTLSRAMAGGNENSPEDMTALIGNCDRIRDATKSHVCIVHHSGKDEARGARGHSSLRAATDTEIEIKRDPELTFSSVRIAKQRDLEAVDPFGFTLQSVALGTNRRGRDVTSCVVMEAEQATILARDPDKLSPKERDALEALEKCLSAGGFEINSGRDMDVTLAVTLHAWKRSLQAHGIIDRDIDNNARTQMRRIRNALVNKGQIAIEGEHVWIA